MTDNEKIQLLIKALTDLIDPAESTAAIVGSDYSVIEDLRDAIGNARVAIRLVGE